MKLQSQPHVPVEQLAEQFDVSKRTIYRDLKALERAGIPILFTEGKGYGLMEGYNLPPVMFTEAEANAIVFGERLISKTNDESLIREFRQATEKIKAILDNSEKEKLEFLAERTIIGKNWYDKRTSNHLSTIQKALTNFTVLKLAYVKDGEEEPTIREVEPFAIYHNTAENWVLIAWCRIRKDFRSFRIDRIRELEAQQETFPPHETTMEEYAEMQHQQYLSGR